MENEEITDAFNLLNFDSCQKLADANSSNGNYLLGYCYEYGIGVEKDENKAFIYYQKSADMNDSNGMYQVGYCYYLGIGVKIDKHKAFTYYLKSAEAGNSMGIWKIVICYFYGIGVEINDDKCSEWMEKDPLRYGDVDRLAFLSSRNDERNIDDVDDEKRDLFVYFISRRIDRDSKYGKCAYCNEDNTNTAWCQSCDPDIATRWTIRNKDIDDCLKKFQLRARKYEDVIEWIPFDRLLNVKKIGKGGFGFVYSATWLDGIRKVEKIKDGDNDIYKRAREPSSIVALKTLTSSKENNNDFLKEFKSLMGCKLNFTKLAIYGITQNAETKEYLMVFQYANNENLHKYLRKNFCTLTWQTKLKILKDISIELGMIHDGAGYIHADFHSGNILQDQQPYIADLGLSRKTDEKVLKGDIYGVMPYVAPEVLSGEQQFTQAADIYGFGAIMSEMTTGQRPFDGHEFNLKLAVKICKGLRPEFAPGTPKCYIELAEKCMNSDPQKRPVALDIYNTIVSWLKEISDSNNDNEINKQFLEADKVIKSLPMSIHSDEMYTSKIISTKLISKAIKGDSTQINPDIAET